MDMILHTVVSLIIFIAIYYISKKRFIFTYLLTLTIGVGKELFDLIIQNEYFSLADLGFDIVGIMIGMIIIIYINIRR